MRHRKLLFFIAITIGLLYPTVISAQTRFDLTQRGGHFYFAATINNTAVDVMVESGIPALLIGESIYDTCLKTHSISFQASTQKIRLLNNLYNIIYRAEGELKIGDVLYDGPIFILKDYDGVSVPIQHLKDPISARRVMTIDLKENSLLVGHTENNPAKRRFKLSFDEELGFPTVAAVVDIATPEGQAKLKGDLIIDFGNPSLLFLLKQHKSMGKAIKRGKIELKNAYNKQGKLVAQGIFAHSVSLFAEEYHDKSIGVTDKMPSIKQLGFLGTQFFSSPVVFDFDNGVMSME